MYPRERGTKTLSDIYTPKKFNVNPIRLIFYATFFSVMLFLLLPLSRMFQDYSKQEELVRSFELVTTPPPPPMQNNQELEEVVEEVINIESTQTEIEIEPLEITLEPSLEGDLKVQIQMGDFNIKQGAETLIADIKMFSLSELDSTPTSLNDPLLRTPPELVEQGVGEINAEALVILNEKGEVEFIQFISLSHQGANEAIRDYIQKLRYTPPTKDGEVGRVRFRLPIRIGAHESPGANETREQRNRQNNTARQPQK